MLDEQETAAYIYREYLLAFIWITGN